MLSRNFINVDKYYALRYRLFHRFDEGCVLDEGWYSVTPEKIAAHIARRFEGMDVVADLFCGPGGNCIQFGNHDAKTVIGIDIKQSQLDMFKQNARVYGVEHKMKYVLGNCYKIAPKLAKKFQIDAIFMSPPWGGPDYHRSETFDVSCFKRPVELALSITKNVSILVPRNVSFQNVFDIFGECEVEDNFLGGKLKTRSIYFGDLQKTSRVNSEIETLRFVSTRR